MRFHRILAGLICALFVLPALAIVPKRPEKTDPRLIEKPPVRERLEALDPAATSPAAVVAREFLQRRGGNWTFAVDRRFGRPTLVQGSGIPMVPGKGNPLGPEALAGLDLPGGKLTVPGIEPKIRQFIESHPGMMVPDRGSLSLDTKSSRIRENGRLISLYYNWHVDGVPVEGASVFVRLNSGNITQFGSRFVGPIDLETAPRIDSGAAYVRLLIHSGDTELARPSGDPELWIQPEDGPADTMSYRLIWKFSYTIFGRIETWEGRVDASTGEIVGFKDANLYARAVGGVYPRSVFFDNETVVPLGNLNVVTESGTLVTDTAGNFSYSGGDFSSGLNGRFFDTDCQGCAGPAQPVFQTNVGLGWVDFGVGGTDQFGNGQSTAADRNVFFHLNQVRRIALKWLPSLGWLQTLNFDINTNIDNTCNATYGGSQINFYRSGGGCNNTGEVADVIYHEWGHGIDLNTLGGDGGTGEGTADVNSMQLTHSPLVGPGFRTDGSPVRNLESATSSLGVHTVSAIEGGVCFVPVINGDSVHCVGQVYGQSAWDLSQLLVAKHGHHTGWRVSERLFYTSLPDAGTYDPGSSVSIYSAYAQADDDDGNLANGTPNGPEIFAAFDAHETAGTAHPESAGCARPVQPALLITPQCDRLQMSWDAVPGVDHYEVFRAELVEDSALYPRGTFTSLETSFEDTEAAPGIDYWYVVMAVDAAGCESTIENLVQASLASQPILSLTAVVDDDVPRGNRSGFPDPGEDVDLVLTLNNFGDVDSSAVTGTISTTNPNITLLDSSAAWNAIAAGGSAVQQDVLRFQSNDPGVSCGDVIEFQFTPDESTGCSAEISYFEVQIGEPDGGGGFVCDSTPACFVEPTFAGLGAAAPGSSCAEVDLSWNPATSNCTNATISYDIYRSTMPGFEPDAANRLASGLSSSFHTDTLLVPGETYHYVVRAFDSRSGEESNTIAKSAFSPTSPDIVAPVFDGLSNTRSGDNCGETILGWAAALETCSTPTHYEIYRSTDPLFVPAPGNRVGSTFDTAFVDVALTPADSYTYIVRARDGAGNEGANETRFTVGAALLDQIIENLDFEPNDAGWTVIDPNDAIRGNWEWGDPEAFSSQPEDDASPDGVNCWMTGIPANVPTGENNDIDEGTTTLYSTRYNLDGMVDPVVRYSRFFSNDRGSSPGDATDSFLIDISNNDGMNWTSLEVIGAGTPLAWVPVEIPLTGVIELTERMRFRFQAADLGAGSLVDAGIDEFELADLDQGCLGCALPAETVGTILVDLDGDDVRLDWTADPVVGARFVVYQLSGPDFVDAVPIGTTDQRTYVHTGAAALDESFSYRISAVDSCGNESALN